VVRIHFCESTMKSVPIVTRMCLTVTPSHTNCLVPRKNSAYTHKHGRAHKLFFAHRTTERCLVQTKLHFLLVLLGISAIVHLKYTVRSGIFLLQNVIFTFWRDNRENVSHAATRFPETPTCGALVGVCVTSQSYGLVNICLPLFF
jgi:hypothetical protein